MLNDHPGNWYTDWSQEDDAAYKRIMAGVGDSDSDSEVAVETQVGALPLIFASPEIDAALC